MIMTREQEQLAVELDGLAQRMRQYFQQVLDSINRIADVYGLRELAQKAKAEDDERESEWMPAVSASEGVRLGPQAALIKLIGETPNPKDQKLLFSTRAAIAQAIIDAGWTPPTSASEPQTEEHNQSPRPPQGGSGVTPPPRHLAEPRDAIQDYYQ